MMILATKISLRGYEHTTCSLMELSMSCTTECTGIEYSKIWLSNYYTSGRGKTHKVCSLKYGRDISPPPPTHTSPPSHAHSRGSLHGLSTTSPISISRSHMTWNTTCTIQNSITHISADYHYRMYSQVNIKGTMNLLINTQQRKLISRRQSYIFSIVLDILTHLNVQTIST